MFYHVIIMVTLPDLQQLKKGSYTLCLLNYSIWYSSENVLKINRTGLQPIFGLIICLINSIIARVSE